MYLLTFDAVPTAEHQDFSKIDGAIILVWIPSDHAADVLDAEVQAREHIVSSHWFIKSLDEVSDIDESEYEPYDRDREYFETVLSGTQAYVFNTYPDREED